MTDEEMEMCFGSLLRFGEDRYGSPLPLYDVALFDHFGQVVKNWSRKTASEVDEIKAEYSNQPWLRVVGAPCPPTSAQESKSC